MQLKCQVIFLNFGWLLKYKAGLILEYSFSRMAWQRLSVNDVELTHLAFLKNSFGNPSGLTRGLPILEFVLVQLVVQRLETDSQGAGCAGFVMVQMLEGFQNQLLL